MQKEETISSSAKVKIKFWPLFEKKILGFP